MEAKQLTKTELSQNIFMHTCYWRDIYNDSLADLISDHNKSLINENFNNAITFLKEARAKVAATVQAGGELTQPATSIYVDIDNVMEKLKVILSKVNKDQRHRITDLSIYPIE